MGGINRRDVLKSLAAAPMAAAAITWTESDARAAADSAEQARQAAAQARVLYKPKFFNAHEWATIAVLVNLIIPKDE